MKGVKKVVLLVLAIVSMFLGTVPVSAQYVHIGNSIITDRPAGIILPARLELYEFYKDTDLHTKIIKDATKIIYHKQGTITRLNASRNVRYLGEMTTDFNNRLGLKFAYVTVKKVLEYTNGRTMTSPCSVSASSLTGVQLKDEPTGYYKLSICQDCYKYRFRRVVNGKVKKDMAVYIPEGDSYLSVVYSKSNTNNNVFRKLK